MENERTGKGFSYGELIGDTEGNLRELLNRTIREVRRSRKEGSRLTNPLNNVAYHLQPKNWWEGGVSEDYYNQRIAIYQHILNVVDKVRGNFISLHICDITDRIEEYVGRCKEYKKELREHRELMRIWRENSDRMYESLCNL